MTCYKATPIKSGVPRDLINKTTTYTVAIKVRYIVVVDKFYSTKCHIADRDVMHAHRALFKLRADGLAAYYGKGENFNSLYTEYSCNKSWRLSYKLTHTQLLASQQSTRQIQA